MSTADIVWVIAILTVASSLQSAVGFGFSLASMPILAGIVGAEHALAVVSLVSLGNTACTSISARAHADRGVVRTTTLAAIACMPLGIVALETIPERGMRIIIAVAVAAAALLLGSGLRVRRAGRGVEVVAAAVSGVLATSTGTSGPPLVIALQGKGMPAPVVRATLSTQFLLTNFVGLALLASRGHIVRVDVGVAALCVPLLLASWWLGARIFTGLSQHRYDRAVVWMLLGAAVIGAWGAR